MLTLLAATLLFSKQCRRRLTVSVPPSRTRRQANGNGHRSSRPTGQQGSLMVFPAALATVILSRRSWECLGAVRAAGSDDDETLHSTSIPSSSEPAWSPRGGWVNKLLLLYLTGETFFFAERHPNQNTFLLREKFGHELAAHILLHHSLGLLLWLKKCA